MNNHMRHAKSIAFEDIKLLLALTLIMLALTLSACSQEPGQNELQKPFAMDLNHGFRPGSASRQPLCGCTAGIEEECLRGISFARTPVLGKIRFSIRGVQVITETRGKAMRQCFLGKITGYYQNILLPVPRYDNRVRIHPILTCVIFQSP